MIGLSHVILSVGLCAAVARETPETTVAMRVQIAPRIGDPTVNKVYRFRRGDDPQTTVELDVPPGVYRLKVDLPRYRCTTSDFLDFIADHDRTITETLGDAPAVPAGPVVLLEGTAPQSFQYVKPTFVLFDSSLACDRPVPAPLPSHIAVENERDAYYVWLHFDGAETVSKSIVAMRLRTPTGLAHYIRLRIPFPPPWGGWPGNVRFNVTEDELDGLATEKTETLLCPKLWETSVG